MSSAASDCDVLVVGAGAAGLCATISAAENGARVVLVEKKDRFGGMLHIANGEFSGAGTRRQTEHGIDDDVQRHFEDVVRISHDEVDRELAWLSVSRQGETVDWLESLGFDFDPSTPGLVHGHEVYSLPRTYWGRRLGLSVLQVLVDQLQPMLDDGRVAVHFGAHAQRLVRDAAGKVCGAQVDVEGEATQIGARAVVLATGGYDANRELRNQFLPPHCADVLIGCLDHADGDGLLMAQDLGATVSRKGFFLPVMGLIPDPERPGYAVDYREAFVELAPAYRTPYEIWVNNHGARFVAEDTASPELRERALLEQPNVAMHIVFDRAAAAAAPQPLVKNGGGGWTREWFLDACEHSPWVRRSETLDGLALELGVNAARLAQTVADFNAAVDKGTDADFGRSVLPHRVEAGPFYAVTSVAASILSRDGLHVDTSLAVLDGADRPIPGLYAVGEVLGNNVFAGDNYVGGMSITPAMTLGRLLGRELATTTDRSSS